MQSLIDFLEDHNVDYRLAGEHHHAVDGWCQLDCPNCSPDSQHFRLGISMSTLGCSCYSCGRANAGEVLGLILDMPSRVVWGKLGSIARVGGPSKKRGKLKLPTRMGPLLPAHERYLRGRKFDPDELQSLWGVQGTGPDSNYPWRLVFPICLNGEAVSFSTRQLHDRGIRYQTARPDEESVSNKTLLYGWDFVGNACIVVEGLLDAIRIGPGAGATMGLTVTPEQVARLRKVHRRVICFDNEDAAQRRAVRLAEQLSLFEGETLNVRIDSHDPGSATPEEIDFLRSYLR